MSYFDDASLVMIPSGYKTSKVYSVKPTDGTGDLAFTRSNDTATRVGPDGLIEKVRTNLALRSQSFATSAVWATVNGTITDNAGTAPDGTNTASKIVATNSDPFVYQALTLSGSVVASCYVKGIGSSIGKNASIRAFSTITNFTITGDWQRVSVAHTAGGAQNYGVEAPESAAVSDEVLLWGFQVEYGDVATPYIATTTAAVSVGPVANVPRLDYLNSSCPRLLLEPQRTNSLTYSEQINNAAWGKLNVTVSANQAVAPDGTTSADLVYPTTTGADRLIEQLPVAVIGQTWTSSLFVKASGFTWVLMYSPNLVPCWFNASTGVFGTVGAGATASVLGQVNGYWRISLTGTVASSNAYLYAGPANANGTTTATANGTNGLLFWGCQVEQGAYATSYIPTLGAAVTRGADAASKTGISSLIGQTEGTLFAVINSQQQGISFNWLNLSDNGTSNWVFIGKDGLRWRNYVRANGSVIFDNSSTSIVDNTDTKIALAYKSGQIALYINGTQIATSASTFSFSSALSKLSIGDISAPVGDSAKYEEIIVFPTRLSNADLAALTA